MFEQFNLRKKLEIGIEKLGFKTPTEIQQKVIPFANSKKNIVGVSKTGSGKTHAFLIPIFQNIRSDYSAVQAVILAPTRELCSQIYDMAIELAKSSQIHIKISLFVGGRDINRQIDSLTTQPQIVIGTPSRIESLFESNHLSYTTASTFVIDEADMTMDLGFFETIDKLVSRLNENCQKMVFSATLTQQVSHHISKYLTNAKIFKIDDIWTHSNIENIIVPVKNKPKIEILGSLIQNLEVYLCFIFANTKNDVDEIHKQLLEKGYSVGILHGGLEPRERKSRIKEIKNLKYRFVVCSDIAARGVDIKGVSHIIHWDLPESDEWYMHRSGRSGRADFKGVSIILYTDAELPKIERLKRKGIKFFIQRFTNGEWKTTTLAHTKKRTKQTVMDKEISGVYKKARNKSGVKPGYKKKLRQEVSKIKRKYKRAMIEEQIKDNLTKKWKQASAKKRNEEG